MPRLKVCGVTDAAFAVAAAERGVDFIGLIFAEASPRCVTTERAHGIAAAVRSTGACVRFVGVFVEQDSDEILRTAKSVPLDVVQLHRRCTDEEVRELKRAGYEVWQLLDGAVRLSAESVTADAVLLDGVADGRSGGTGRTADWSLVPTLKRESLRVVLAGGISAANLAGAVATGADVLDVNSALETSPGVKSLTKLEELMEAFRKAEPHTRRNV